MKTAATRQLRARLASDQPVLGLWVTLESASLTEAAVALGMDWVVVDAEHGHLDWKEILEHVRATARSSTVVLVRLAQRDTALAKRALDIGADGIVIPWIETAEQLALAIGDCRYPPQGRRGIGGERATAWGQCFAEHAAEANQHVLVVPMIESVSAIPHVEAMGRVDGAELFFFGPADFSASAGYRGQWEGPGVAESILQCKRTLRSQGKHCGVMTTSIDDLQKRMEQGFRMLGVGSDCGLILRSLHQVLRAVGRDRLASPSLDPADGSPARDPLPRPPQEMRPDRDESMWRLGSGPTIELQEGVTFETQVGDFNAARNLTTGIVRLEPRAELDRHVHPCSESITVLEGEAEVTVEGRVYRLRRLDNIAIPRWAPHSARNASDQAATRLHVALAMSRPERELTSRDFPRLLQPDDCDGFVGMERVTRIDSARRLNNVGTGAEFVDYFNARLVPGIEMSGGYGRFFPGGRLPAHVHDFDESICIIDGVAQCQVEGRAHVLSDCATALVPRGRVHFFINQSSNEMEMIWVYAGPMPERLVVDEACATQNGDPWK